MTPFERNLLDYTINHAYTLLPAKMDDERATHMLLAIGYQESRFTHRAQIKGPARGFWQFEKMGGVQGVLQHKLTKVPIRTALLHLNYPSNMDAHGCWAAIEHNDVLAFCFARLLLFTVPQSLPAADNPTDGWEQYLSGWRPGKPHPATWGAAWAYAARLLNEQE
jgi:hypothetical protein